MSEFSTLDVPASNGTGTGLAVPASPSHTIIVSGSFLGTVTIEVSNDDINYVPAATFQITDFTEIPGAWAYFRVVRAGINPAFPPGLPVVTVGCCPQAVDQLAIPEPVTLNGAGAAFDVSSIQITGIMASGAFPAGTVASVEISQDGTYWTPLVAQMTRPRIQATLATAKWARYVVSGRTSAAALPTVWVCGPTADLAIANLTPPVGNGSGAAVDTSQLGAYKTFVFASSTGDLPCRVAVEGTNDGGTSWCDVLMVNAPGLRFVTGIFQKMRMTVRGLTTSGVTLAAGMAAIACLCPEPAEGDSNTSVATGGV